ncbi:MAG: deoxyribonuclease IV [Bacteroidota bacterium]
MELSHKKWVGAHVSAAGGVENTIPNAVDIKAEAFALFTKNQRRWTAKPLSDNNIIRFKERCKQEGFTSERILPHASYLINLGNPTSEGLEKSRNALLDEMQRCEKLGITMLNVHPGAHLDSISEDQCLERIASSIDWAIEQTDFVEVVLENTAGQGTSVGYKFEHLEAIIQLANHPERVGYCIDTCHAYAAGYDLRTKEAYTNTMDELANTVGLEKLKGLHLNDSKKELGSRVDRHDCIGEGEIGWDAFGFIMNDERLNEMPLILETPNKEHWAEEISSLYELVEQ